MIQAVWLYLGNPLMDPNQFNLDLNLYTFSDFIDEVVLVRYYLYKKYQWHRFRVEKKTTSCSNRLYLGSPLMNPNLQLDFNIYIFRS